MRLNRETGAYVYNLIAMKAIISQPKKYGYKDEFVNLDNASLKPSALMAYN
jgi:membrane-bound lytic murein transglycosylase D